jgi:hypothetical protein
MGEIPKGLTKAVVEAKERPQYIRKILVDQVGELCGDIIEKFTTHDYGSGYLKPIGRIVDRDYVAVKLEEEEVPNNGGSITETSLKIAVNPSNRLIIPENEFTTLFTDSGFGVRNKLGKDAEIEELTDYLEILKYYRERLAKEKKDK